VALSTGKPDQIDSRRIHHHEAWNMGRLDEDTSMMRLRRATTLIDLHKPELEPQSRARGIAIGALLGALLWVGLISLGMAVWWKFIH
jgi:hypothetical protein